jgi:hypothetical protein
MSKPIFGMISGIGRETIDRAKEIGVDYVELHFNLKEELLLGAITYCQSLGLKYVLNIEALPLDWTPPEELRNILEKNDNFLGFVLDECDHMQLNAHWAVVEPYGYHEKHYFAETESMDIIQAQKVVGEAIKKRKKQLEIDGKDIAGEYLYPVMMHTAAASGVSASPKILKETYGPAMIAVALGASLQYGGEMGIDVDAWWHPETVGHSVERFKSALMLAYWSGADRIYVEGGYGVCNHPVENEILMCYTDFINDYVPAYKRPYSWRDFKPDIAIVRFDDTCFDEHQKYQEEYPGPLYGHIPAQKENTEWLNIWNLLSHGFIRTDSVSHQWESRSVESRTLFAPLSGVAVFDHNVDYLALKCVKLIFLSGVLVSIETINAVKQLVKEGATCVVAPRFLPELQIGLDNVEKVTKLADGKGCWIIVPDFYSLHYETWCSGPVNKILQETLNALIGDGEQLIYNFGEYKTIVTQKKDEYSNTKYFNCKDIPRVVQTNPDKLEIQLIKNDK